MNEITDIQVLTDIIKAQGQALKDCRAALFNSVERRKELSIKCAGLVYDCDRLELQIKAMLRQDVIDKTE